MINSSSLSKAVLCAALAAVTLVVHLLTADLRAWDAATAGAALALTIVGLIFLRRLAALLDRAAQLCEAVAHGDLEGRILELPEAGVAGRIQRGINATLDIVDAFVREATGSASHASRGRFYRKILTRGLPGEFRHAAAALNLATETMESRSREVGRFADNFERSIGSVVAASAPAPSGITAVRSSAWAKRSRSRSSIAT